MGHSRATATFLALSTLLLADLPHARADRTVVVIDPGHGGSNVGAPAALPDTYEKELTLVLARGLAARLRQRGIDAVLTRERDEYLTLRQRMKLANELGADLFVSLHGNATPARSRRGFETFILTPEALEVDARALRLGDGPPRLGVDRPTAFLLDDLERGEAHARAAGLAAAIQRELAAVRGSAGDRGVRQASMHVLLGATMPAVLVEVGFIDNAEEGPELFLPEVQTAICDAIAAAIAGDVAGR
jgi:N-acetylmuramoyl-L-alanine amidase